MRMFGHTIFSTLRRIMPMLVIAGMVMVPDAAWAGLNMIDGFNLAPFVPIVLDALMSIATGGYEFFVGDGNGIIYVLVWTALAISLGLFLIKMYLPQKWVAFFGLSGGGEMISGIDAIKIAENILKPGIRAIIAAAILLQLRPVFLTQWLVNPFLQFGAIYTHHISDTINANTTYTNKIECPQNIIEKAWISPESCEFLVQPVAEISNANNQMIKRGFEFLSRGLRGLITPIPHGGEDFMNIVTGTLLIFTFVGSNLFMALLIIQAIFDFGMALILYPFQVLTYVVTPNDKWLDIWPAFAGITKALQRLIITMIACAFILCINIAVIKALFRSSSSVFVVAAGGSASSNVPQVANSAMGFGEHSITWMSAILTFYLMFRIFELTRKKLDTYVGKGADTLYKQVTNDAKTMGKNAISLGKGIGKAIGWIKSK